MPFWQVVKFNDVSRQEITQKAANRRTDGRTNVEVEQKYFRGRRAAGSSWGLSRSGQMMCYQNRTT
jgi:hypothetical protein